MRAEVYRNADDALPAASGHAYELKSEGYVQRTSYIEVGETSAVGRALAMCGFEVKRGIAGREESDRTRGQASNQKQPTAPASAPQAVPGEWNEDRWLAGEAVRKEIVDLENEVDAITRKAVHTLRQFVREKFNVAGPYECKATDLNMYKSWMRSLK
ncbi:MAG: hypothetical protein WBV94_24815 [Blastocatellia bacterium]